MSNGESDQGVIDQGPSPLFTPDQMRRLRLQVSRSPFYCEQDYTLEVVATGSVVNAVLRIFVRFETLDGQRKPQQIDVQLPADRSYLDKAFPLGEGFLFGVSCSIQSGLQDIGSTWVEIILLQGGLNVGQRLVTLLAGFPTLGQVIAWPYGVRPAGEAVGLYRAISGTQPLAGNEVIETCPTGARWELVSAVIQLSMAAAATNRYVRLLVGSAPFFGIVAGPAAVVPDNLGTYNSVFAESALSLQTAIAGTPASSYIPLPLPCVLLGGHTFQTTTLNRQPTDQFSAPLYVVRETLRLN